MSDPVPESAAFDEFKTSSVESSSLRWFQSLRRFAGRSIWVVIGFGLLLRMTVRDQYHPLALIYYLTPIPSLPIWLFLANLACWRNSNNRTSRSRRTFAWINGMLVLSFIFWGFFTAYVDRSKSGTNDEMQLVFWNTPHGAMGISNIAVKLRNWDAPVIALVEADNNHEQVFDEWKRNLPGYEVGRTSFNGLVAVRGKIVFQKTHSLLPNSWCERFDLIVDGHEFTLLLVDISSHLFLSRRSPLHDLAILAEELSDRPLIIVGDFNTPDDSVWFEPLRKRCRQSFREHGSGYAATWPIPLPVLTLDQVWVNEFVVPSKCENGWSIYSDHRPVFSSVSFADVAR